MEQRVMQVVSTLCLGMWTEIDPRTVARWTDGTPHEVRMCMDRLVERGKLSRRPLRYNRFEYKPNRKVRLGFVANDTKEIRVW